MATIVLGAQWGDEGKGKITDILMQEFPICARASGGHNAGHSIVANGVSYSFHLLPSGLLNPKAVSLIGTGCTFSCRAFFSELEELEAKGLHGVGDRLFVSDRCHINFDLHAAVDGLEEVELGQRKIGTTGRGIGPSYANKAARSGVRLHEIFDEQRFEAKLRALANGYKKRYGDLLKYDVEEEIAHFKEYRPKLARHCVDAVKFIKSAQDQNRKIMVEG
ncbi:hypothetical protein DL763_009954 [Monosporascus cannonballus]|nr:hypothetical protein DL763_009954 [Monosporascus cannonballus]